MGFTWDGAVLTIDTSIMQMKFDRGLVFYIKDLVSEEVLVNSSYAAFMTGKSSFATILGFSSLVDTYGDDSSPAGRGCKNANITYADSPGENQYRLKFDPCVNFAGTDQTNTWLQYDFTITSEGEVEISLTGYDNAYEPWQIDLPVGNFSGVSSIFMAQEVLQNDGVDYNYLYVAQPPCVVGKGNSSVFGVWSENNECISNNSVEVRHYGNDHDEYLCHTPWDPVVWDSSSATYIYGGPWRFTTQTNWVEVARRWRLRYLTPKASGGWIDDGSYLWENPLVWFRDIHCMYGRDAKWSNPDFYNTLAANSGIPASKTLAGIGAIFNNGVDPWVLFGEIDVISTQAAPRVNGGIYSPENIADSELGHMIAAGYKPLFYWYYCAVQCTDNAVSDGTTTYNLEHGWLNRLIGVSGVPTGWDYTLPPPAGAGLALPDFNPDYSGTKTWAAWKTYWADFTGMEASYYSRLQAACPEYRSEFLQMWKNMCSRWGYAGGFWDTLGSSGDRDKEFHTNAPGLQVVNGVDYQKGTRLALQDAQQSGLLVLHEYFSVEFMPYVPYGFEGYWKNEPYWTDPNTNLPRGTPVLTYVNHPFRTACLGSFQWSGEQMDMANSVTFDFKLCALLGTLPEWSMNDYQAPSNWETFKERARLFSKFELFNDLPNNAWADTDTIWAYYRSNTGNMFRCEDRGSDVFAYVEEHWQGDYDRLVIDTGVVTIDNIDEELPSSYYTRGSYISLPSDDTDLATPYNVDDISDVATDDTDMVAQLATSQIAIHQFKQEINGIGGIINVVAKVTIPCSTSTTYLQIYNRSGTPAWDTIDSDNATGANTDFTLSATVADLTDYKDENNIVACRVYQEMQ